MMIEQGIGGLFNVWLNEYKVVCGFLSYEDAFDYLISLEK